LPASVGFAGSPLYGGSMKAVYDKAFEEVGILAEYGVDGFIVENFRDKPFYPLRSTFMPRGRPYRLLIS
jgi:predicted TIM-barrel enzyme